MSAMRRGVVLLAAGMALACWALGTEPDPRRRAALGGLAVAGVAAATWWLTRRTGAAQISGGGPPGRQLAAVIPLPARNAA